MREPAARRSGRSSLVCALSINADSLQPDYKAHTGSLQLIYRGYTGDIQWLCCGYAAGMLPESINAGRNQTEPISNECWSWDGLFSCDNFTSAQKKRCPSAGLERGALGQGYAGFGSTARPQDAPASSPSRMNSLPPDTQAGMEGIWQAAGVGLNVRFAWPANRNISRHCQPIVALQGLSQ